MDNPTLDALLKRSPLTAYRHAHNLSQLELSKLLRVSQATVSRWEEHKRWPDPQQLRAIHKLTGIDPLALLPPERGA